MSKQITTKRLNRALDQINNYFGKKITTGKKIDKLIKFTQKNFTEFPDHDPVELFYKYCILFDLTEEFPKNIANKTQEQNKAEIFQGLDKHKNNMIKIVKRTEKRLKQIHDIQEKYQLPSAFYKSINLGKHQQRILVFNHMLKQLPEDKKNLKEDKIKVINFLIDAAKADGLNTLWHYNQQEEDCSNDPELLDSLKEYMQGEHQEKGLNLDFEIRSVVGISKQWKETDTSKLLVAANFYDYAWIDDITDYYPNPGQIHYSILLSNDIRWIDKIDDPDPDNDPVYSEFGFTKNITLEDLERYYRE